MLAQCAKCGMQVRIEESQLGEHGAKVRCPRCGNGIIVERPAAGGLELDLGDATTVARSPFAASALDPIGLDLDATKVARTPVLPAAAARPPASIPAQVKQPDDDLLVFADADLVDAEVDPTVQSAPPLDPARAATRVGPVPNLAAAARRASQPLDPSAFDAFAEEATRVASVPALRAAAPAAAPAPITSTSPAPSFPDPVAQSAEVLDSGDELVLSGGLAADGTFEAPRVQGTIVAPGAGAPAVASDARSATLELAARETQAASTAPGRSSATSPRTSTAALIGKGVGVLFAVALLLFGALVFLRGGKLDEHVLRFDRESLAALVKTRAPVILGGLQVTSMRSVLYPARAGTWMLVLFGEVRNTGSAPEANVEVIAELRDAKGRVVASERAPLGITLGPAELNALADTAALASLYDAKRPKPEKSVSPGSSAPFTVVMLQPPPQVESLEHDVSLARVPPPPPVVQPAPPAEPVPEEAPPAKAKLKGKGKGKGKAKAKAKSN